MAPVCRSFNNGVFIDEKDIYLGNTVITGFYNHYIKIKGEWRDAKGKGIYKDPGARLNFREKCAHTYDDLAHGRNIIELPDGREMTNREYNYGNGNGPYHERKNGYNGDFIRAHMWPEMKSHPKNK